MTSRGIFTATSIFVTLCSLNSSNRDSLPTKGVEAFPWIAITFDWRWGMTRDHRMIREAGPTRLQGTQIQYYVLLAVRTLFI
jgi:hypothetical protein